MSIRASSRAPLLATPAGQTAARRRGESRRRAMLEAARQLFLERGFGGTSVSAVVKRSGGSLATLYAWFGSKEGLFEAIVEDISSRIVEPLDTPEFESQPLDQALQMLGERFLSLVLSAEGLAWCRMSVAEGAKFPELRAALNRTGPGHVHDRLAAYLAMQARAGRLQVDNPFRAALHFFALIKSEDHFAALCGETIARSPEEISTQVRAAVRVFLGGYAA